MKVLEHGKKVEPRPVSAKARSHRATLFGLVLFVVNRIYFWLDRSGKIVV